MTDRLPMNGDGIVSSARDRADEQDMIRLFAAAFCSKNKSELLPVSPSPSIMPLTAVVTGMRGRARFLKNGLKVTPLRYRPVYEGIRVETLSGGQLLFLAGVCSAQGIAVGADRVTDPPSPAEQLAVLRVLKRTGAFYRFGETGMSFGKAVPCVFYEITPDTPELYTAGVIVGAALSMRDVELRFSLCKPSALHLFCVGTLRAFGGSAAITAEGLQVDTRWKELPRLPEKLRKKHKLPLPEKYKERLRAWRWQNRKKP